MTRQLFLDHNNHALLVVKEGNKYLHAVAIQHSGVRLVRVSKCEPLRPATWQGKPYPASRAARAFRAIGKRLGITRSARRALNN